MGTLAVSFSGMANEVVCKSNVYHIAKVRYRHRERVLDFCVWIETGPFERPATTAVNPAVPDAGP